MCIYIYKYTYFPGLSLFHMSQIIHQVLSWAFKWPREISCFQPGDFKDTHKFTWSCWFVGKCFFCTQNDWFFFGSPVFFPKKINCKWSVQIPKRCLHWVTNKNIHNLIIIAWSRNSLPTPTYSQINGLGLAAFRTWSPGCSSGTFRAQIRAKWDVIIQVSSESLRSSPFGDLI